MHRKWFAPFLVSIVLAIASLLSSGQTASPDPNAPKINDVRFATFPPVQTDGSVKFRLAIEGESLPADKIGVSVIFDTKDPAHAVSGIDVVSADGKEVLVEAVATPKTEITRIRLAWDSRHADTKAGFTISIAENPPKPKLDQFDIKLEHEKNKEFSNLHTVVLTKGSGDGGFDDNPRRMTVDLMPSGASDVNIVQSNPQQLDVHFVAAADYVPTSAVITVYDSTDLDKRKAIAVAATKKTPADPNEPKVSSTEIVFINRSHGIGRIRIYGKGFGDEYGQPPYPVDDYLWNCLQEFHIRGMDRSAALVRDQELEDLDARLEACAVTLGDTVDPDIKTKVDKATQDVKTEMACEEKGGENCKGNVDAEYPKKELEYAKTNLATYMKGNKGSADWKGYEKKIRDNVTVSIHSRNPDIQVERVEILNINDKMIDVYFEFTRYRGFSYPLRLESSTVTIKKTVQKTTQTTKNDKLTGTVTGPKEETYSVSYQIEPKRDPNLTYKYTILDDHSANTLLGKGIADNFYVLQLSVVNSSQKKVAIPLAAIQAEIEWKRGTGRTANGQTVAFGEGPPTLSPIPLAAVSSSFEAYQKVKGFRAHLFNALDAATVMATALVPFTGPSFKDAEVFFSGGFVPGVHKAWGDLSSQQLQNLTALSWESSETLPAQGGSIEKLIYIEKKAPEFRTEGVTPVTRVQIASILGMEVTGYEILDSQAKTATPAAKPAQSGPAAGQSSDQKPDSQTPPADGSTPKSE